jgi:uncharacterized membrane protein
MGPDKFKLPAPTPFDRSPFGILALIVSAESIILTIFVLISQNRLMRQAEKRAHLDLQVGLLAEQELTALVQMVHKLCEHAGVNVDYSKHAETLGKVTDMHKIARELDESSPRIKEALSVASRRIRAGLFEAHSATDHLVA